jgi:MYXO-CTERM domain-containing protein
MSGARRFGWFAIAVVLGCTSKANDDDATKRGPRAAARRALAIIGAVPALSHALAGRVQLHHEGATWIAFDGPRPTQLPDEASAALHLAASTSEGAWIDVVPQSLQAAPAVEIDGALVMNDAAPATDVVYLARKGGVEELRVLRSPAAATTARYRVQLGPEIADVRVTNGRIEAIDRAGDVVIESDPMWAVDARGVRRDLDVTLDGRTLVATLDARGLAYPIVVDPTWTTVGSMTGKRFFPFGTHSERGGALLPGGKVLVAGGHDGSAVLATSEVYDVGLTTWATAGSIGGTRVAPLTALTSGKVLIAGGSTSTADCTYTADAEVFDPTAGTAGTWSAVHAMTTNRDSELTATLLADGRVFVAGGAIGCGSSTATAEIYDPTANTWTPTASMSTPRRCHVAALIAGGATGKILVAGGVDSATTAEVYNPATNTWTPTGALAAAAWCYGTAVTLPDGRVLLPGGYQAGVGPVATSQIYDPASNTWSSAASMASKRHYHAALTIAGKALVIGGNDGAAYLASAELYDPIANTWSGAGSMSVARYAPAAVAISGSKVLVAGGRKDDTTALTSAEILTLTPATDGSACAVGGDCTSGVCIDGVCCDRACDGQCEACNVATSRGTCTTISGTPRGSRPACSGSGTCGGTCNGTVAATCTYPTSATTCGAASCSDATHLVGASTCNGAGSCVSPASTDCAPGTCSAGACVAFDAGVTDTAIADTAAADTAVADTAVADTAVADTAVADTAVADTAVADTAIADTAVADTAVADTAVADTAVADTGTDAADTATASDVTDSIAADTDTAVGVDAKSDTRDASPSADSGADAGEDAATGGAPIPDAGCGCTVPARDSGSAATVAVVGLAALLLRRRRAR